MRSNYQKLLQVLQHSPTVRSRFWSAVQRTNGSDDCWLWRNDSDRAGLMLTVGQFKVSATRLAWYFATGELPDGGRIRRQCDNDECVRASHLAWEVGRATALRLEGRSDGYASPALVPNASADRRPHAARLQFVIDGRPAGGMSQDER